MRHQPRKRFGQNFLRDDGVIDDIERAIAPTADDHLVEIGPGEGALTQALMTSGCKLDAVELDRNLTTRLLAAFSIYPGFTLHSADALDLRLQWSRLPSSAASRRRQPALQHFHTAHYSVTRTENGHRGHALHAAAGGGGAPRCATR